MTEKEGVYLMNKLSLLLIAEMFNSLLNHMTTIVSYVIANEEEVSSLQSSYNRFNQKLNEVLSSAQENVDDQKLRDFIFFIKCESTDYVEQLDLLYYKSLRSIRSYDSEIRSLQTTLGKMKTEIEEQVNEMGEMLLDHQKSIENLYTNQSLMIGLTSSVPLELETAEDNTEETKIEDIID